MRQCAQHRVLSALRCTTRQATKMRAHWRRSLHVVRQPLCPSFTSRSGSGILLLTRPYNTRRKAYVAPMRPAELYREASTLTSSRQQTRRLHRWLLLPLGFVGVTSFLVSYNWDFVKQRVGKEGAEVVREGIKSEDLQITAFTVSKALLQEMLRDEDLLITASEWITKLLRSSENQLTELAATICQSEPVLKQVRVIADDLVRYLCNAPWVHEKVGELLVYAINTPYARESATAWVVDLLSREEISAKLEEVVTVEMLNNESVRAEAIRFAANLITSVLESPKMLDLSREHVAAVLGNDRFQDVAGGAAWSVFKKAVTPRWLQLSTIATQEVALKPSLHAPDAPHLHPFSAATPNHSDPASQPTVHNPVESQDDVRITASLSPAE